MSKVKKQPDQTNQPDFEQQFMESEAARLRLSADYQNLEKHFIQERANSTEQATIKVVKEIFPIFDNFYRASNHAPEINEETQMSPEQIKKIVNYVNGLKMIEKQLEELLARMGLRRILTKNQPFDLNLHEAISYEKSETVAADHIIDETEAGWQIGNTVIRPAKVRVSQG